MIPQIWHSSGGYRTLSGAQLDLPLYPFLHLAPNGMVFNSGPNYTTRYLDATAATRGKASITAEAGHAGTVETEDVEALVRGCQGVRHLHRVPQDLCQRQPPPAD